MIAADAPTAAPADTPTIPGSASGFEKTACMTVPATARAAPTSTPSAILGNRTVHRVEYTAGSAGGSHRPMREPRARKTSPGETLNWPATAETTTVSESAPASARNRVRRLSRFRLTLEPRTEPWLWQ